MLYFVNLFPATLRDAFKILKGGNPLILASSTAFFTTFSLPPIILILVNIFSFYFKSENVSRKLFFYIKTTLGEKPAEQIESIVKNFQTLESNTTITIVGFVFFAFVATTLLMVIQQSIHLLWHITIKTKNNWKVDFIDRARALMMIFILGILFLASQLLDAMVILVYAFVQDLIPSFSSFYLRGLNIGLSSIFMISWMTILFKYLPDAKVKWEVAFGGGVLTGILFMFGKFLLHKLLIHSNIANIFGASASFAIILLFIFYSSFIVYFGAAFTYAYGIKINKPIIPDKYSNSYIEKIIDPVSLSE